MASGASGGTSVRNGPAPKAADGKRRGEAAEESPGEWPSERLDNANSVSPERGAVKR